MFHLLSPEVQAGCSLRKSLTGKEVIRLKIKYHKPSIAFLATAVDAVKGTAKGLGGFDVIPSNPAYLADE